LIWPDITPVSVSLPAALLTVRNPSPPATAGAVSEQRTPDDVGRHTGTTLSPVEALAPPGAADATPIPSTTTNEANTPRTLPMVPTFPSVRRIF
jgi:hypothetical protein